MVLLMGVGPQAIAISAAAVALVRTWGPVLLFGATLLWVLPIFITHSIGDFKNRNGLAYGFLLGWLGVLVITVMPSLSPDDGVA